MAQSASGQGPEGGAGARPKAALDDTHWSRARGERNREVIEYYRQRSRAPGVAGGGAERNFYCMSCDGVIPFEPRPQRCPHCCAELDEHVVRYFNWVEISDPPRGDARAVLGLAAALLALAALVGWLLL
jgi:hypothetical protein